MIGGIEGGGTKFVCAIAKEDGTILREDRFPTTTPAETIGRATEFFRRESEAHGELKSIGIASFGPVDLDRQSSTYGFITTTPKPGWAQTRFAGAFEDAFRVPVGFDTDVNGAALGESKWGAGQGLNTLVYFTIGTGIGGGAMVDSSLVHGMVHPEMGHIRVRHDLARDPYSGSCPYHGDCFEGMASGPAIGGRWGVPAYDLSDDHPAWDLEADYIADALHTVICTISPQRIILGGGVMEQQQLFPMIRKRVQASLNGYVQSPAITDAIDDYIVPPALGNQAGIKGALALALAALDQPVDL
ncbi:MAG: ROK family protein [Bacteroidetes bacterium]|nr:ROK family protein [Bacteroidota bacterium]